MPYLTPLRIFSRMSRIKSTVFNPSVMKNIPKSNNFPCKCTPVWIRQTGQQITVWNIVDKESHLGPFVMNMMCHVASGTHCSLLYLFLGAFAQLRTAPSWPFVRSHGKTRLPLDGFSWNFIWKNFSKICRENSIFIKIGQYKRALSMKTNKYFLSYLAHFFLNGKYFEQNL